MAKNKSKIKKKIAKAKKEENYIVKQMLLNDKVKKALLEASKSEQKSHNRALNKKHFNSWVLLTVFNLFHFLFWIINHIFLLKDKEGQVRIKLGGSTKIMFHN